MGRLLTLLIATLLLLSSCSVQKRAQRHLRKAIELDPTILSTLDTKVKIDTVFTVDTIIQVNQRIDTARLNIDSLVAEYKAKGSTTLLDNDRVKIDLKNIKGKQTIVVVNKVIKVPVRQTVRLTITRTVKANLLHERVPVKGFFYWTGVVSIILIVIFIIIFFILNKSGIIKFFSSIGSRHIG